MLTEGQMSDHIGAVPMLTSLPHANVLLSDKGYDSGWLHPPLERPGNTVCIPPNSNRKIQYPYDQQLYRNAPQDRKHV